MDYCLWSMNPAVYCNPGKFDYRAPATKVIFLINVMLDKSVFMADNRVVFLYKRLMLSHQLAYTF